MLAQWLAQDAMWTKGAESLWVCAQPLETAFVAQLLYLLMVKIIRMVPKKQRSNANLILAETAIARLVNLNQFCFEHKPTLHIF